MSWQGAHSILWGNVCTVLLVRKLLQVFLGVSYLYHPFTPFCPHHHRVASSRISKKSSRRAVTLSPAPLNVLFSRLILQASHFLISPRWKFPTIQNCPAQPNSTMVQNFSTNLVAFSRRSWTVYSWWWLRLCSPLEPGSNLISTTSELCGLGTWVNFLIIILTVCKVEKMFPSLLVCHEDGWQLMPKKSRRASKHEGYSSESHAFHHLELDSPFHHVWTMIRFILFTSQWLQDAYSIN